MHLYRDIQKWMYNSWSAFSNPFSDYPNTLTSSTTDISPIQRIWTSGVKSASRLTLSSMTAVEATVVTPTKDQKNYSFVLMNAGDFDCLNPSSCFDTSGKRWFQSTHEHRNFWSRIFLSRTYLFANHKLNAEKNNATWLPSFWSWLLSRNWIFLSLPFRKSKSGYFVAIA